mgnify:CR=1 FL=1
MALKCEGLVGTYSDNPVTFAPNNTNQDVNQDPLKPVCPVINTFLPDQKLLPIPKLTKMLCFCSTQKLIWR